MRLKFIATKQIRVHRDIHKEVPDFNDGDVHDVPDERGNWLLKDFPKNFIVVTSAGSVVDKVKAAVTGSSKKEDDDEKPQSASYENKASSSASSGSGRGRRSSK